MIKFFFIIIFVFLQSCSKPETVLICGDHECINKKEAKLYFEENLSLEVKVIDPKNKNNFDLVELNLKMNAKKRQVNLQRRIESKSEIRTLSKSEISNIKKEIKKKEKISKSTNKVEKKEIIKPQNLKKNKFKKKVSLQNNEKIDVCTILEKCSIDEISKYLIRRGNDKTFPKISTQN